MRGSEDAIYIVTIFFTFVLGIGAIYVFYMHAGVEKSDARAEMTELRERLGIPDGLAEKIGANEDLRASVELKEILAGSREIVVRNSGEAPLSSFVIGIDGQRISPAISPDVLFPGSYGIILLDNATWDAISGQSAVEITTKQGAGIIIRK